MIKRIVGLICGFRGHKMKYSRENIVLTVFFGKCVNVPHSEQINHSTGAKALHLVTHKFIVSHLSVFVILNGIVPNTIAHEINIC